MPPIGKLPRIADRSHKRRGHDWAHAFDLGEFLARDTLRKDALHHAIGPPHSFVERHQLVIQFPPHLPAQRSSLVGEVVYDHRQLFSESAAALRNDDAPLRSHAPDVIDQGRTLLEEATAQAVNRLNILTLDCFARPKPQVRPRHRFPDRFRIPALSLVPFDLGLHKLGTDEFHGVAQLLKLPRPVLRTATRLHPNQARRELRHCFP